MTQTALQRRFFPGSSELQGFHNDVLAVFATLLRAPFASGREVEVAAQSAGTFNVTHGLKRKPRGFFVLDLVRAAASTGDVSVYRRTGDTLDATTLQLYTSASFDSLRLWVW